MNSRTGIPRNSREEHIRSTLLKNIHILFIKEVNTASVIRLKNAMYLEITGNDKE